MTAVAAVYFFICVFLIIFFIYFFIGEMWFVFAAADSGDRLSGNRFLRDGSGCVGLGWIEVGWVRLLWVGLGWGD